MLLIFSYYRMIYTRHSLKLLYGLIICSNFLLVEGIYAGIDSISISNSYSSSTLEAARIRITSYNVCYTKLLRVFQKGGVMITFN